MVKEMVIIFHTNTVSKTNADIHFQATNLFYVTGQMTFY